LRHVVCHSRADGQRCRDIGLASRNVTLPPFDERAPIQRVGQAQGYQPEEILHLPPEAIARAGEGDEAAMRVCDEQRFKDGKRTSSQQRPSMGQDMQKGRRTEIEFLNGLVVREGEKVGLSCAANAALTDIVKRVERGELSPDPRHITELRLN
jgi:2-dehydropantoate 2-reductase